MSNVLITGATGFIGKALGKKVPYINTFAKFIEEVRE